jgi:hypothetical protein
MPNSVPLALVEQREDQGLFRYPNKAGGQGGGWIAMTSVRQQP